VTADDRPDLTDPQRDALMVLAAVPGKEVQGGKHKSQLRPVPYVNMRAVDTLIGLKLARAVWAHPAAGSNYTHDTHYMITDAGITRAQQISEEAARAS
jgi:hypothetical protein